MALANFGRVEFSAGGGGMFWRWRQRLLLANSVFRSRKFGGLGGDWQMRVLYWISLARQTIFLPKRNNTADAAILQPSSAQRLYPPQHDECICAGFAEAVSVLLLDSCCYCYNIVVFFVQTLDGFRWIWRIGFVGAAGARSEADAGQFGGCIMFGRMTER